MPNFIIEHAGSSRTVDATSIDTALTTNLQHNLPETLPIIVGSQGKYPGQSLDVVIGPNSKMYVKADEYNWTIKGQTLHHTLVTKAPLQSVEIGRNHVPFELELKDGFFKTGTMLRFESNAIARVQKDPTYNGSSHVYHLQLLKHDAELTANDVQIGATVSVAGSAFEEGSQGGSFRTAGMLRLSSHLQTFRKALDITDDAIFNQLNIYNMTMQGSKVTRQFGLPQFITELYKQFKLEQSLAYWFSQSSRSPDGSFRVYGDTGREVKTFDGIDAICKEFNYMSVNKLTRDIIYNITDHNMSNVTLIGGAGALQAFHEVISVFANELSFHRINDKFISVVDKEKQHYSYGAAFTAFKAPNGRELKFIHEPLFDRSDIFNDTIGPRALPRQSYALYCIPEKTEDGDPNLVKLVRSGFGGSNHDLRFVNVPNLGININPTGALSYSDKGTSARDVSEMHLISKEGFIIPDPRKTMKIQINPY